MPLGFPSSVEMGKAGADNRLGSRMWSCSELREGLHHVREEGHDPVALRELEVGL